MISKQVLTSQHAMAAKMLPGRMVDRPRAHAAITHTGSSKFSAAPTFRLDFWHLAHGKRYLGGLDRASVFRLLSILSHLRGDSWRKTGRDLNDRSRLEGRLEDDL
jgi:hypothetical protein